MRILHKSLYFADSVVLHSAIVPLVLVSATCIGNDKKSCPLFHGSLAPILFSEIETTESAVQTLHCFLLSSHNITWIKTLSLSNNEDVCCKMISVLLSTRYFSRSVKKLIVDATCLTFDCVKVLQSRQSELRSDQYLEMTIWSLSFSSQTCSSLTYLKLAKSLQ
jgi:hypothetical protein